jgi:hypothetical protein
VTRTLRNTALKAALFTAWTLMVGVVLSAGIALTHYVGDAFVPGRSPSSPDDREPCVSAAVAQAPTGISQ